MKYSDLISFHPIEDVIQLVTAENLLKSQAPIERKFAGGKRA